MAKRRKSTRRRRASVRGFNTKDVGMMITQGILPGAVGAVILRYAAEKFLPAEYQQHTNYAIAAAGISIALLIKNPMAKAAGLGAATVAASNIGADLMDGQMAVKGMGLLRPGVPSVRIADRPFQPADFGKVVNQ